MKVAFLIANLQPGGAERVASLLCSAWARSGDEITVITYEPPGTRPHFVLDERVELVQLDLVAHSHDPVSASLNNLRRLAAVRRELSRLRPDVLVSFIIHVNVIAALAGRLLAIPTVVSERIHPAHHRFGRLREWARRRTYPLASAVVVQTEDIADWMRRNVGGRLEVLPNPVDAGHFEQRGASGGAPDGTMRWVTAVGRLSRQKGFDILLGAFAEVAPRHPGWRLKILGEGECRDELEQQAHALDLGSRVEMPGAVRDVAPHLAASDLFVHPARYEGYPNALVEALASGCATIATDAPGAAAEILDGGKHGRLVRSEDVAELARAMDALMRDDGARRALASSARDAVRDLDVESIAARWSALLRDVTADIPDAP